MIIVAFEGLDKSGKASSLDHVAKQLSKKYKVGQMDFHRYNTDIGQIIMKWLRKENNLSQQAVELLMAADKVSAKQDFEVLQQKGYDVLLLDRFKMSQYAYSMASGVDPDLVETLQELIPDPDFTVYLDVDPAVSMARQGKHGENDRYESDHGLLSLARSYYLDVFEHEHPSRCIILDGGVPLTKVIQQLDARVIPHIETML